MRTLIFCLTIILCINVNAQDEPIQNNIFVRIYDFQDSKIAKGKIHSITDNSIYIKKKNEPIEIPVSNIYRIKSKRSAGNNIVTGTVIGAATLGIIMARPVEDEDGWFGDVKYSAMEGALYGVVTGGATGAVLGAITIPFKSSKSYRINGDPDAWKTFKEMFEHPKKR